MSAETGSSVSPAAKRLDGCAAIRCHQAAKYLAGEIAEEMRAARLLIEHDDFAVPLAPRKGVSR
jgi:hypothetical protein